jgi:hypothetical protein
MGKAPGLLECKAMPSLSAPRFNCVCDQPVEHAGDGMSRVGHAMSR